MNNDEKMQRLNKAKASLEELTATKERLNGVLETKRARVQELEEKARNDFGCEIEDIPDLVEKLDKEAQEALEKAERLLAPQKEEEDAEDVQVDEEDEDALI